MRPLLPTILLSALTAGCIPYATGTTPAPVATGEFAPSLLFYFVPGGMENLTNGDSTFDGSLLGWDTEVRYGVNAQSDLGVRIPGMTGVVVNYKRLLTTPGDTGPALAALIGTGVVNAGEHWLGEASLLVSSAPGGDLTPYGGLKAMHVLPLTPDAVSDDPTVGLFGGLRIGSEETGLSVEVGVFYDRPALGLRDRDWIVVPSFTLHGNRFLEALMSGGRGWP